MQTPVEGDLPAILPCNAGDMRLTKPSIPDSGQWGRHIPTPSIRDCIFDELQDLHWDTECKHDSTKSNDHHLVECVNRGKVAYQSFVKSSCSIVFIKKGENYMLNVRSVFPTVKRKQPERPKTYAWTHSI